MKAICHNCKFHKFKTDPNSADVTGVVGMENKSKSEKKFFLRTIWYNQYCTKSKSYYEDHTTGITIQKYKHCREVNRDGNCSMFKYKEEEWIDCDLSDLEDNNKKLNMMLN